MWVKKKQLESYMKQLTGSKSGKEYVKAVYCHCLFNLYAEYIMLSAVIDESQAGIKIARRKINNLRYADCITLMAGNEELKSFLMRSGVEKRVEKKEWRNWL